MNPARILAMVVAVVTLRVATVTPASAAITVNVPALQLLARLQVVPEHPGGYARSRFAHWIDADRDGCDTRDEVLNQESRTLARIKAGCVVIGTWRSAYDGVTTTKPTTFDIDHMVPLKEVWDSGAWSWTPARREVYANDLGDSRSLRAVSAASNRSKGDSDPAQLPPPLVSFRCTYVTDWVVVKVRWSLGIDAVERAALKRILGSCPARTVRVAVVRAG